MMDLLNGPLLPGLGETGGKWWSGDIHGMRTDTGFRGNKVCSDIF